MSILSSIIGAITAPQTATVSVSGDGASNDFTGTSKNDKVIFDATVNVGESFKVGNADWSKLDGGAGIDTLVIKLTESQNAALKAEMKAKLGALFNNGLDCGELASLFKIATGQTAVKFESIGVELKGWELISFDVVKDVSAAAPAAPAAAGNDKDPNQGNPEGNNAAKDDVVGQAGINTTFTINDLLVNDPGGANKNGNLFFGDSANQDQSPQAQAAYLAAHGITKVGDTYQIGDNATDFNYWVQVGNNGTWSMAHVTVRGNHTAVVKADELCINEDEQILNGSVKTNDSDSDGDTLTYVLKPGQTLPAGLKFNSDGTYEFDASVDAYQHLKQGAEEKVTVEFTVSDGESNPIKSCLVITVKGTNDKPVAEAACVDDVVEDGAIVTGRLVATDKDDCASLSFKLDKPVDGLTINADGSYSFDPNDAAYQYLAAGEPLKIVACYTVTDEHGACSTSTLTIKLTGVAEAPPACSCSCDPKGALVAGWTFENHTQEGGDNVGTPSGFWNLNQWAHDNPGAYGTDADVHGFTGDIQVHGVNGYRGLDTAGSPGNIFLQAIPEGRGGVLGQGATMPDLVADKLYIAEVSILKQSFTDPELVAQGWDGTDPDAWVEFWFNGSKLVVKASDITVTNDWVKFDVVFKGVAGEDGFVIQSHGTHDDNQGLIIDYIKIHEWNGHLGAEELTNWNFEADNADAPLGFIQINAPQGWTNEGNAQSLEVSHADYPGNVLSGYGAGEKQWLDSAATPGDIKIGQDLDIGTGHEAQLSVFIAAQDIMFNGGNYKPDADDHLLFKFNGTTVLDIDLADFTDSYGNVDWNKFRDFKVNVTGQAGADHLTIESTGNTQYTDANNVIHGYAGFAVDHVSVKEWKCGANLFTENFDEARVATFDSNGQTVSADINLAAAGWTGESGHGIGYGAGTEVGISGALSSLTSTSGTQYLDTQNTPGGIDIKHTFTDTTAAVGGKTATLSFDIGKMAVNWNGTDFATDPNASFDFKVDGQVVKHFDASDFANANQLQHVDVDLAGYAAAGNTHTLELVDNSGAGYFGFAIDSIQINDWVV